MRSAYLKVKRIVIKYADISKKLPELASTVIIISRCRLLGIPASTAPNILVYPGKGMHRRATFHNKKSLCLGLEVNQIGVYIGFRSMKRPGVFLIPPPPPAYPPDRMLVHRRVTPSIKIAGTHLYAWEE